MRFFSFLITLLVIVTTSFSISANEVMTDRCSQEVIIVPYYNAKPGTAGQVRLKRGKDGRTEWTDPFKVKLSKNGRIRWYCGSGRDWTAERSRCNDRSTLIRARLGKGRLLNIECLGKGEPQEPQANPSSNSCLNEVRSCMINCEKQYSPSSYSVTTRRKFKQCKENCDMEYYKCTTKHSSSALEPRFPTVSSDEILGFRVAGFDDSEDALLLEVDLLFDANKHGNVTVSPRVRPGSGLRQGHNL